MDCPSQTRTVDGFTCELPFRNSGLASWLGMPADTWLTKARRGDEQPFLTTASDKVLAAFGIAPAR